MDKVELPAKLRFDFPTPIGVISCCAGLGQPPSLLTVGAISHACGDPPMLGVAVGHTRYTHSIISCADGFVFNVPSCDQVGIVDYCGSVSGRDIDKFKAAGLTPLPSARVSSPGIAEFPINIECAIRHAAPLGSHTFYFGEIVTIHCARSVLTPDGTLDVDKLAPMTAFLDSYWDIGRPLMQFHDMHPERVG